MSYQNMWLDHSGVAPSSRMLAAMRFKRENSKPAGDWCAIKWGPETLAHACSPRCCDMAIAILVAELGQLGHYDVELYQVTLREGHKGVKHDYRDVRCFLGCRWRVA